MRSHSLNTSTRRRGQFGFSLIELLTVVIIGVTIAAMAIPYLFTMAQDYRASGNIRGINGQIALAKLRAAADFTQARFRANLSSNSYEIEVWDKNSKDWKLEGGVVDLSDKVSFGFGSLSSPPSQTQTTLSQAPACLNDAGTGTIPSTACVLFNSRGIPVDGTGSPYGDDAIYVTDGSSVYGVTVSATALTQTWISPAASASWRNY